MKDSERTGLGEIQEEKRILFEEGGKLQLSLGEASLALGIPQHLLRETFLSAGHILLVKGEDERIIFRLEKGENRDLWQEVLESLGKGRKDTATIKNRYHGLFTASKMISEGKGQNLADLEALEQKPPFLEELINFAKAGGDPAISEIDLENLHSLAILDFLSLPEGIQKELEDKGSSPKYLLSY